MKFPTVALLAPLLPSFSRAFLTPSSLRMPRPRAPLLLFSSSTDKDVILSSLTPQLQKLTTAFRDIGDDKLRYKQLLYMANQLPPPQHPEQVMLPSNKVPGCLSTVYIDGSATFDPEKNDYVVHFVGESDGLLTKGLVALLVRGLSGCTAKEISKVNPEFIQEAKISQSLTPGRNNGFLNMLNVMKNKAVQLTEQAKNSSSSSSSTEESSQEAQASTDESSFAATSDRPMYNSIMASLQQLQPVKVELRDTSYQHAGHAGAKGLDGESHFELEIVADAFEGLNLVKRHKLVYMILGKEMPKIHALSIKANTPSEVGM